LQLILIEGHIFIYVKGALSNPEQAGVYANVPVVSTLAVLVKQPCSALLAAGMVAGSCAALRLLAGLSLSKDSWQSNHTSAAGVSTWISQTEDVEYDLCF
jgi:hypothetical protein